MKSYKRKVMLSHDWLYFEETPHIKEGEKFVTLNSSQTFELRTVNKVSTETSCLTFNIVIYGAESMLRMKMSRFLGNIFWFWPMNIFS